MVREEHFQISTVARLTGLTVHNIRAWEKRHGVVRPGRTDTKRRMFTREDIRRLSLLKALVDAGHPIGMIAPLSVTELEGRLEESHVLKPVPAVAPPEAGALDGKCRVLVVGGGLRGLFEAEADELSEFQVVAARDAMEAVEEDLPEGPLDLLIVDTPTLFAESIGAVRRLLERTGARRALLVYGFAQGETLKLLMDVPRITPIRGPIRASELKLAALAELHVAASRAKRFDAPPLRPMPSGGAPQQKFSREQLGRLSRISSAVQCECPQHLGNLLSNLTAFEQYSLECQHRNPEDAELHAFLHDSTARARAMLEEALTRVLEFEGIQV